VSRATSTEGRIRREPGLCLGCGRCVTVCTVSPAAGRALRLTRVEDATPIRPDEMPPLSLHRGGFLAVPRKDSLRASGCTFCGQCVMVCPTGALTAPGESGSRWLEGWRKRTGLLPPVLPPDPWRPLTAAELATVPTVPGVLFLADVSGRILRIGGVADLSRSIVLVLAEPACATACSFRIEPAPLFTQRESELLARFAQEQGHLPPGNDLGDDLFADNLFSDDFE
jgi:ferredoxin